MLTPTSKDPLGLASGLAIIGRAFPGVLERRGGDGAYVSGGNTLNMQHVGGGEDT